MHIYILSTLFNKFYCTVLKGSQFKFTVLIISDLEQNIRKKTGIAALKA
jgi:hypothetical protein